MNALLDGVRRTAHRLAGRARRRLSGNDGGFVLLESIIAISLITVIMAAVGAEYVASVASVSRQRSTQSAAQIANSALEQVRALKPSDLVVGRGATSVATQFDAGNAVPTITPWLQKMDQASDANATATAGANATIPTCDPTPQGTAGPAQCTQKPSTLAFTVSQFIGTCWLVSSGASSNCVPAAQKTSSSVSYLRVVVSVGWTGSTCGTGCYYVTSTLINAAADPTFRANQPPVAAPVISGPGDQNNDIGDAVNLQLGLVTGTGVPGYAWTITSGSLPPGLSITSAGVISGVVGGSPAVQSITVQVTDGYGRTTTSAFTWTVANPPTILAPPDQVTPVNTAVNLKLTTSCANTPCTYTLNNAPTGLSISNTGLITGTPTVAGTSTTSVTIVDASGRTLTSNTFQWAVLPIASSCSTAVNLPNGGFETPTVAAGAGRNVGNGSTGMVWRTNAGNGQVEYWANGSNSTSQNGNTPIAAQDGTQWIETDGSGFDTIYQDLATTPGQVLQWSLWHRARNTTKNVNAQDSIQVQMGTTTQQAAQVAFGSTSPTISDGAAAWVQYTGSYTVPAGQTTTRFQVTATATSYSNSSAGNFLDAVSVTTVPCLATPAAQTSTVNTAITGVQLSASQGSGSYLWSGGATLPAGLTLSANGLITGTPTSVGTSSVQLIVTDQLTKFQQLVTFTWTVLAAPTITTPANQTTSLGASVNLTVGSTCANTPCTYSASALPAGLTLNADTGTVTGTSTTLGSTTSTITIRDAAGATATSGAFTWTVVAASTITTPANQKTTLGAAVSLQLAATCNYASCTYALNGQPAGLTVSNSGLVSGTPTTVGTSSAVSASITDAAGATVTTAPFSWTIYARPTIVSPGNQVSTVNSALILPISSTCSNTSCSYALSGAPAGLSINSSTGRITGTPTATGTSTSVKVTMTDAGGVAVNTGTFTWNITSGPSVTSPGNQSTVNNATVSLTLTKSCPNTPCAYALNGGPAGLSISGAGVVTGTVTSALQTFTGVTITVTDSSGVTATSAAFTWTVTAPLAGHWTFDEASGSTAADTAAGHPVTLTGTYGRTTTAAQGANALSLTGAGYASTIGSVLNTANSFTVSAWAKLNSTSTTQTFVSQDGTQSSAFALQYRASTAKFAFTRVASDSSIAAATVASADTAPTIGQWYQLTGVYDSVANTLTLYVNGVRQGAAVAYSTGWNGTGNFAIGRGRTTNLATELVNGAIDDVRAYSTALSDDAVAQIAQGGYWRLNEGSGTTAKDSSLNGADGTLNGGTTWTTGTSGSGLQFNGSGSVTTSATVLDPTQSYTVSAWAKPDTTNSTGAVVSVDGTNISSLLIRQDSTQWLFAGVTNDAAQTTTVNVKSTSTIVTGQWYHLVGVYDSVAHTLALYVNGVLQGSPVPFTSNFQTTGPLVIGRSRYGIGTGGATNFFRGAADDVRAYRFAMDQTGVNAIAVLTPPAPAAPTASAGSASASVSWTAPANVAGNPVTGYVVTPYLDGVAQTPVSYSSTATSQTVTNLTTGGSYTFSVAAVNANGTSPTSAVSGSVLVS